MTKKRIPYGVSSFEALKTKNCYFIDKTNYIPLLEEYENPVFLRPRRFGKSLLCSILNYYYDLNKKKQFDDLFGDTYIGKNPTPLKNSFMMLRLDFSVIKVTNDLPAIEHSFNNHCNNALNSLVRVNQSYFGNEFKINLHEDIAYNLDLVLQEIRTKQLPQIFVTIDEYDNFSNQLIISHNDHLYKSLTTDESFLKTFFKALKWGRQNDSIFNIFITGVLPITMDDLSSGFNIASFITLDPVFTNMLGYTQKEVDTLLDNIYRDYELDTTNLPEVKTVIKNNYNGYSFIKKQQEELYNSTILMYFLRQLCSQGEIPEFLTDENLKVDINWVKRLTASNAAKSKELVDKIIIENALPYDRFFLKEKFSMSQFFTESYYPISFYYLGMLTMKDDFYLQLPNTNMKRIFIEYFNELNSIDVSTKYAEMMRSFAVKPDMAKLFSDYWRLYICQFPEAIFQKVNENFYRSTFYELCGRYLSRTYTWNLERSYPQGKSDLEFVGKYNTDFAGFRYIIEFKYYSNNEVKKQKLDIKNFQLIPADKEQLDGYCRGLKQEYPEARVSKYLIYCFGNRGYRVFEVE
ncbi:MAG: AAA family ATPase [bacterium]|nr:AAA family ATPase [bacterium]